MSAHLAATAADADPSPAVVSWFATVAGAVQLPVPPQRVGLTRGWASADMLRDGLAPVTAWASMDIAWGKLGSNDNCEWALAKVL